MGNDQVIVEKEQAVTTVWLNREEVRNAFNEEVIQQLIKVLETIGQDDTTRLVVLRGKGPSFCAGADLNWMKKAINYSLNDNLVESRQLSKLLYNLYTFPKPTFAIVHGAAIGGGIGLLAACDFVFSEKETRFSFSEVKIGLVPACIAPYAIKRIGEHKAKQLMLTGKTFDAVEALKIGLVDFSDSKSKVESEAQALITQLLNAGPEAIIECKKLIHQVVNHWSLEEASDKTAELIASIRSTKEAQEGMKSFLEKRNPYWRDQNEKG